MCFRDGRPAARQVLAQGSEAPLGRPPEPVRAPGEHQEQEGREQDEQRHRAWIPVGPATAGRPVSAA